MLRYSLSLSRSTIYNGYQSTIIRSMVTRKRKSLVNEVVNDTSIIGLTDDGPITTNTPQTNNEINTGSLLIAISDLDKEFNIRLRNFPNMIVVGSQSGGKTSLIEAICGKSFLPKKNDMATKKPFNITTIKSDENKFKIRDQIVFSERDASDMVERLNENPSIQSIDVEIHGPDLYNARFTDLPGLYYVSGKGNKDHPRMIKEMNEEYIRQPNNKPIVVSSASTDPATNQAIQIINDLDRSPDSLGILTKVDLTKRQDTSKIRAMLGGALDDYNLGHGWIATILRNQMDIKSGMTVKEKEKIEREYFLKHPEFSPSGVETIRKRISDIQFHGIKDNVPRILEEIDVKLEDLKQSGTFLSKIIDDPKNRLAGRLQIMIEKLVGSSLERAEFEEQLRYDFGVAINGYMIKAISPKGTYTPNYSTSNTVDRSIIKYHSDHISNPNMYVEDTFGNLFRYGMVSPIVADNDAIQMAYINEASLATSIPIIYFTKDDPLGKKRLQWNKFLNRFFSALLRDNSIQDIVYEITESRILTYIKDEPDSTDGLSHKFAEYIVREIGSKAYAENIQFSITSMINTERRPNISLIELCRELSQMYPSAFTFDGSMFESYMRNNNKLTVEVYGEEFNEAYLKAVSTKLSDNIYRNIAVNLLDNMVRNLLEMTIDMFNKDNVEKETLRVNEKISKLESIKTILSSFK